MKRKLKKLSLVLGLILMASFTIGISKVSAAETKAIKFESRYVMETIKIAVAPRITNDMVDLENLTLNLTQEQIDSIDYLWLGPGMGFSIDNAKQYIEDEKNIAKIDGVEYKKISLKGIENFKNIKKVHFKNKDVIGKIQIDLSELKELDINSIDLNFNGTSFLNINMLGKFLDLSSLTFDGYSRYSYNHKNERIKTSFDFSNLFPLDTKEEEITINMYGFTLNDEEVLWNYISSTQNKKFRLEIDDCGLTHVPSLKNVIGISFTENNIKSVGELPNIDFSIGLYDCDEFLWGYLGGYNQLVYGENGVKFVPALIPLFGQNIDDISNDKAYNLPRIFEQALKIDKIKYAYGGDDVIIKYSEIRVANQCLPDCWSDGAKIEVKGATLSADNKQVIFADDVKDGDVATVEVLGGIAHGTKLTLTYKAPAQEEKPAEDNKGNNVDDKKDETIIEKFYNFLEGANQTYKKGDNNGVTFRIDGGLELFDKAYVDSIKLDKSSYTLQEGSTIIKLNSDYVNTLSNGKHELSVSYTDGKTATTSFTILAPDFKQNPDTGVTSLLAIQAVKI